MFLHEILTELRDENIRGQVDTKDIRDYFQLTIAVLKTIKEGQADFATKIDEMKKALNKDIDKKPEIFESSSESGRDSGPRSKRTDSRQVRIRLSNELNKISELDEELYASPGNRLELF